MGASYAASSTELVLGDSDGLFGEGPLTPRLRRQSVSASLEYRIDDTWSFVGAAGASLVGDLDVGGDTHSLDPGVLVVLGLSRAWSGLRPNFFVMGMSLGVSSVTTQQDNITTGRLTAGDARLSFTAGRLFWDALAPYAVLRLFGGPILWQREGRPLVGGTDRYHVQAGLGVLLTTEAGFDAFVELAPAGERTFTSGVGLAF